MELVVCFIISIAAALVLLYYYFHNKERRIERYLVRHKKDLFVLLEVCYFVLTLSLVFNVRFIIYETFGKTLMDAANKSL